jgi:hypothetical protein
MKKRSAIIILALVAVISGNYFWVLFSNVLQTSKLLTDSPVNIVFSFVFPIIALAVYLTSILYFSILFKNRIAWIILAIISFLSYYLVDKTLLNFVGGIIMSLAVFGFLFSFQRTIILINKKASFLARFSVSLTLPTLIISIVIAITFYNLYRNSLLKQNVFVSNEAIVATIQPVVKIYLEDLNITDGNETFGHYLQRRSHDLGLSTSVVKKRTLASLNLQNADQNDHMAVLINRSLKISIIDLIAKYKRQIPLLVSLGLGIIAQVLLSIANIVSSILSLSLLPILKKMRLVEFYEFSKPITYES